MALQKLHCFLTKVIGSVPLFGTLLTFTPRQGRTKLIQTGLVLNSPQLWLMIEVQMKLVTA